MVLAFSQTHLDLDILCSQLPPRRLKRRGGAPASGLVVPEVCALQEVFVVTSKEIYPTKVDQGDAVRM